MKIVNDVLQPKEVPILITGLHTEVKLLCKYPKNAVILCCVEGYSPLTYFPLIWNGNIVDEYLEFSGKLLFDKNMIDHINERLDDSYLTFKIYSTQIDGKQKFTINYASINRVINALPNTYLQLVNTVNEISVKLDSYINGDLNNGTFNTNENTVSGMIPIAVDNKGNYNWDYPFVKEKQIVADSIILLTDISKQITNLTNRVNSLEDQLLKHIYVEYE